MYYTRYYNIAPKFCGQNIFMILPNFCDSLVFHDFEVLSPVATTSCCQENFVAKIFVIIVKFTKITKIFDYEILELYGMQSY